MSLLQDEHAFELLAALVAESPADETEATLECTEERFARFAPSGPTQSADREGYTLALRARFADAGGGFREARAVVGSLDPAEARAALQRAVTLARLAAPDPWAVPLGGAVEIPATAPERPTQDHTFREKNAWIAAALARAEAEGLLAAGLARTEVACRTLVNSCGRAVHAARSAASFSLTALDGGRGGGRIGGPGPSGGAGSAEALERNVDRIDAAAVIERAIGTAVRSRGAVTLKPRPLTVVLEPRAVASLLLFAQFGAQEYHEGESFLCGRVGERMFPLGLHLVETPGEATSPGWVFDGEGTPVRRTELLVEGAFHGPVTDGRWARRLGVTSSGHAPPQPSTQGPVVQQLSLAPGPDSLEELIAGVEDGLFVSQLHYVNVSDPRDLLLTGTTRNGTFRIEGGRVTGPVQNLRFTDSLIEALTRVTGIGATTQRAGASFEGECVTPALRIEGLRFTS